MTRNNRHLSVDDLTARIRAGDIDTVVVAFTDMQGRLQGKRLHGHYFVDVVLGHGTEGCNYLLGVDIDMNTVDGYAITSWDRGYGDMEFVLDLETIRLLTHVPATAMVQCDLVWPDHAPVVQSPRSILKAQQQRAAELGYDAVAGTELEFIVFEDTYEDAHDANYRDLTPANQYNVDYSKVQDVNLTSVYLCCKAALPYMIEQGKGSIINTASFVAIMGAATSQISYSASKGGVLSMSRELGVQFAREGVRVNALCPGPVNTPLLQELFAKDEERAARRLVHIPMGRFGEPEEMANAVLFLASDESSFMTASTFLVDGGISGAYVTPL